MLIHVNMLQEGTLVRFSSVIVLALLGRHFFSERYSLSSEVVDFSSLASFKRSVNSVDLSKYLVD